MGYIQLKLPKRIKHKIENSRRNREAQANHEEWLQSQGLDNYTLKQRAKKFKGYDIPNYQSDPNHPKTGDKIPVAGGRKAQPQAYSAVRYKARNQSPGGGPGATTISSAHLQ